MDFKDIPGGAMEALEARVGVDIRGLSDIPARGNSKTISLPSWLVSPAHSKQSGPRHRQVRRADGSVGP
jgi:hypothetical protein